MRTSPNIPLIRALGGTALAAALVVTAAPGASAESEAASTSPDNAGASVEQLQAMKQDLDLSKTESVQLLQQQDDARTLESELRDTLGSDFAGAVFDTESGTLEVSVTDAAAADAVRDAGAEARVVEHGEPALDAVMAELNEHIGDGVNGVTGWYADVADDTVVMTVEEGETAAAEQVLSEAGVDAGAVTVEESEESPQTYADIVGGDPYYINGTSRCSIGFGIQGGFVTAGHCGAQGATATGASGGSGTFLGSIFPGSDMAYVGNTSNWTPTSNVRGSSQSVGGSQEASIGSSVCRSGSTTGWHCGVIEAKNQSVSYPQGTVHGMTRTTVCAEPGDSGGPYITGNQAQGVTSGGSGNCSVGGTTYYQPVNPILSQWGLTLLTG